MSQERVQYAVKEPNPTGIPARWLRLLYRLARLEAGKMYNITIVVPEKPDSEPTWGIGVGVKVENGG